MTRTRSVVPRCLWSMVVLVLLSAMVAGCDGKGSPTSRPDGADPGSAPVGDSSITSGGTKRTFVLVQPPGQSGPAPVVIMMHGARAAGLGRGLRGTLGLDSAAASHGIVTVYPDGDLETHSWHLGCCYDYADNPVDVQFISDLIDHLVGAGIADPDHVVVGGFSAGGFLANELGCQLSGKITGVLTLAGGQLRPPAFVDQVVSPPVEPCTVERPVSHIAITGTDDHAAPIEGYPDCADSPCGPGQRGYGPSMDTIDSWWREFDDCDAPVTGSVTYESTTDTTSLARCAQGTFVGSAQVEGASHSVADLRAGFDVNQAIIELALGQPPAWATP